MQDTQCQAPICEKCGEPMVYVETVKAEKEGKTVEVKVFTCVKDKTFRKIIQ